MTHLVDQTPAEAEVPVDRGDRPLERQPAQPRLLGNFAELGVDPERETFTAAGIGDMSGDVFGNGVLLYHAGSDVSVSANERVVEVYLGR